MKHELFGVLMSVLIALAIALGSCGGTYRRSEVAFLEWRVQANVLALVATAKALGGIIVKWVKRAGSSITAFGVGGTAVRGICHG